MPVVRGGGGLEGTPPSGGLLVVTFPLVSQPRVVLGSSALFGVVGESLDSATFGGAGLLGGGFVPEDCSTTVVRAVFGLGVSLTATEDLVFPSSLCFVLAKSFKSDGSPVFISSELDSFESSRVCKGPVE